MGPNQIKHIAQALEVDVSIVQDQKKVYIMLVNDCNSHPAAQVRGCGLQEQGTED